MFGFATFLVATAEVQVRPMVYASTISISHFILRKFLLFRRLRLCNCVEGDTRMVILPHNMNYVIVTLVMFVTLAKVCRWRYSHCCNGIELQCGLRPPLGDMMCTAGICIGRRV